MSTTAQQIESYKGDSALAGGLGEQGAAQVDNSIWKMTSQIEAANEALRARNFQKQAYEYQTKVKDRDHLAELINADAIKTTETDPEARVKLDSEIQSLQNEFVDAAKKNLLNDSGEYIRLHGKYKGLVSKINTAKTNYAVVKKEMEANAELYDPNSSSTQKQITYPSKDGKSNVAETTTSKGINPRRSSANQESFNTWLSEQKKRMSEDPNYLVQPFVPIAKYDQDAVLPGVQYKEDKVAVGNNKTKTILTPSYQETYQKVLDNWGTNRQDFELYFKDLLGKTDITQDGLLGNQVIVGTNKLLREYNKLHPDNTITEITTNDSHVDAAAKINFTRGGDFLKPPTEKTDYNSKVDEAVDQHRQTSNIDEAKSKSLSKFNTDQEIRKYNATTVKEAKAKLNPMMEFWKKQYEDRSKAISDITSGLDENGKKAAYVKLDEEFMAKLSGIPIKPPTADWAGAKGSANNLFGWINDSELDKAFNSSKYFSDVKGKYKTAEAYKNAVNSGNEDNATLVKNYQEYLSRKAGGVDKMTKALILNFGGAEALNAYGKKNYSYTNPKTGETLYDYLTRAYSTMSNDMDAKSSKWSNKITGKAD